MNVQMEDGGSGSVSRTEKIVMNFNEMVEIATSLQEICDIYTNVVQVNINHIVNGNFYEDGEAKEIVDRHRELLEKSLELGDNYGNAAAVVYKTLEEMIKKDEELQKILEVSG